EHTQHISRDIKKPIGGSRLNEPTADVMRDIITLKVTAGRSVGHNALSLYNRSRMPSAQLFEEINARGHVEPATIGEAVAQTLLVATYTAPDRNSVIDNLAWLPSDVARAICYRRPSSDQRLGVVGISTRRLLSLREIANSANNSAPLWYTEILRTADAIPLSPCNLPSRMWAPVVHNHPPTTVSAQNLLPLTSVISLAALGHPGRPTTHRNAFGILVNAHQLDIALQSLWSGDNLGQILSYYHSLHDHLSSQPPPIDYDRRRRLFPNATVLYGRGHPYPNPARFVWQILTGSDPFSTTGAARRFGPLIDNYGRFAERLTPTQKTTLVAEARRLLIMSGITDEPVFYAPAYDGAQFRQRVADELDDLSIDDVLIPGTHITALRISSQDRDPETILQLALSGDHRLAHALIYFATTAGQHQVTAARDLRKAPTSLANYEDLLEVHLGRVLHTRGRRGNPRALTPVGIELRDMCIPHLAQLSVVAGVPIPASLPSTIDND
ncbi:hypothetical protein, partial [Gordonia sp. N1V]|uniref:hypothetical protein n=1 Tax=Gordonia sp. N1V TaxID=3034163 RepID=UPI0023E21CA5